MIKMKIRSLSKKDIAAAVAICKKEMIEGSHAKTYFELSLKPKELKRDFQHMKYWVAEEKGKVIGVSGLYQWRAYPADTAWIGYTAIHPNWQRKGIGRKLIEFMIKEVKKKGFRLLLLEMTSSEENEKKNFYFNLGFKEEGRIRDFWGKGVDQVYMSKKL